MTASTSRAENTLQVAVLLATGGMAAAASFTHMHDWTMANSPAGTGDWFGWTNAIVADLIPMAAALEVRRRRRVGQSIGYPLMVLVAFAGLSLAAQVACAKPSASGWLLACVPALGFLALTKLVLSRTSAEYVAIAVTVQEPEITADTVATIPDTAPDIFPDSALATVPNASAIPAQTPPPTPRRVSASDTADAITRLRAEYPDMSTADIADRLQVSDRTVRRYLAEAREVPPRATANAITAAA